MRQNKDAANRIETAIVNVAMETAELKAARDNRGQGKTKESLGEATTGHPVLLGDRGPL